MFRQKTRKCNRRQKHNQKRRLNLEGLETRRLMAGNGLINLTDDGELRVTGTKGADAISITWVTNKDKKEDLLVVVRDRENPNTIHAQQTIPGIAALFGINEIYINGLDGNDLIDVSGISIGAQIHGGAGDDTIKGTQGSDLINGGKGSDTIKGNKGNDILLGDGTVRSNDLSRMQQFQKANRPSKDSPLMSRAALRKFAKGGGVGNDNVDGGDDADLVLTGAGCDTLSGGRNAKDATKDDGDKDILVGGKGRDNYEAGRNDKLVDTKKDKAGATLVAPKGTYPQQNRSPTMACHLRNDTSGNNEDARNGRGRDENVASHGDQPVRDTQFVFATDEVFAEHGQELILANDADDKTPVNGDRDTQSKGGRDQTHGEIRIVPSVDFSKLRYSQGVDAFFRDFGALDDEDPRDPLDLSWLEKRSEKFERNPSEALLDPASEDRTRELLGGDDPIEAYREAWLKAWRASQFTPMAKLDYPSIGYEVVGNPNPSQFAVSPLTLDDPYESDDLDNPPTEQPGPFDLNDFGLGETPDGTDGEHIL